MLTVLGEHILKNGKNAVCHRLETPDTSSFSEQLKFFYQHKNEQPRRGIINRLNGLYADESRDCYFFAVIDGRIVSSLWYGSGRKNDSMANFGHVCTAPAFRGLGLTTILLNYFREDFALSPVMAAFCTCSTDWIAGMYRRIGFQGILPGSISGRLMLLNAGSPDDFQSLAGSYFRSSGNLSLNRGSMKYSYEIDCLAAFRQQFSPRSCLSLQTANFQQALYQQEQKYGEVFVWKDRKDHCHGWSFTRDFAPDLSCFDYSSDRNLPRETELKMVQRTLNALRPGPALLAAIPSSQHRKKEILLNCGFHECGRIPGILMLLRKY